MILLRSQRINTILKKQTGTKTLGHILKNTSHVIKIRGAQSAKQIISDQ